MHFAHTSWTPLTPGSVIAEGLREIPMQSLWAVFLEMLPDFTWGLGNKLSILECLVTELQVYTFHCSSPKIIIIDASKTSASSSILYRSVSNFHNQSFRGSIMLHIGSKRMSGTAA